MTSTPVHLVELNQETIPSHTTLHAATGVQRQPSLVYDTGAMVELVVCLLAALISPRPWILFGELSSSKQVLVPETTSRILHANLADLQFKWSNLGL